MAWAYLNRLIQAKPGALPGDIKRRLKQMVTFSLESSVDRYLKLVNWGRARYRSNGVLVIFQRGKPSQFSRLENAAYCKYVKRFENCKFDIGDLVRVTIGTGLRVSIVDEIRQNKLGTIFYILRDGGWFSADELSNF